MTIGSLFSGIGGLELGLERAGLGPVVWQVEINPFCRSVLAKHWPKVKRYEDVREVGADSLEPVDLVCGGFPCIGISDAGKREGLDNEESALWWEFARVVAELLPRFVVIENVAALRSRGLAVVLGQLATLGYDATWDCIPAAAVGAPHRRDRLFVVAWRIPDPISYRLRLESKRGADRAQATNSGNPFAKHLVASMADSNGRRCEGIGIADRKSRDKGSRGNIIDGCSGQEMADTNQERRGRRTEAKAEEDSRGFSTQGCAGTLGDPDGPRREGEGLQRYQSGEPSPFPPGPDDMHAWRALPVESQPAFCRITYGIPHRLDRLRALGNAVVPAVAEVVGSVIRELM